MTLPVAMPEIEGIARERCAAALTFTSVSVIVTCTPVATVVVEMKLARISERTTPLTVRALLVEPLAGFVPSAG